MIALVFTLAAAMTPLNDLGSSPYAWGYEGGLWENGSNQIPAEHLAEGLRRAEKIQPLDVNGFPSPSGKVVFLAVGYSEASRIFCCEPGSFTSIAASERRVNHDNLVFLDATNSAIDATAWGRSEVTYDRIKNVVLAPAGVTEEQVQVAWVQLFNPNTEWPPLPVQFGDAYQVKRSLAATARLMRLRYPNLQILYLSSRVFGGYSNTNWNPEPYAYESGLSVRWVVVGQVETMRLVGIGPHWDSTMGDVSYSVTPWMTWGPYLWANGTAPRSDGLTWERDDFEADGATLSERGAAKGARLLLNFLLHEPTAAGWFAKPAAPVRTRGVRH